MMLDKKLYERYLEEINGNQLTEKEVENLTIDYMNLLIQDYIDKQYDKIQKELSSAKRFKQLFEKQISNRLSYHIGEFSMLIRLFEILIRTIARKESFRKQMIALYAKAGVKEVLEYIYYNPDSQHKTICERTAVKNKSYLSQLLKQLETAGCVERYSGGKTSFFSLSIDGQAFVKDKINFERINTYVNPIEKYHLPKTTVLPNDIHRAKYDYKPEIKDIKKLYSEVK